MSSSPHLSTLRLSSDARAAIRSLSADDLRAAARLAERREKAAPEFTALGFAVADLLGVEPSERGDAAGKRWAARVMERVRELHSERPQGQASPAPAHDAQPASFYEDGSAS